MDAHASMIGMSIGRGMEMGWIRIWIPFLNTTHTPTPHGRSIHRTTNNTTQAKMKAEKLSDAAIRAFKNSYLALVRLTVIVIVWN